MAAIKHAAYRGVVNALTTELNALASAAASAASAAIDNSTNLDLYDDLELLVTFGTGPAVGRSVDVYQLPSVDATNYADGGGAVVPNALLVASFPVRSVTTAQRLVQPNVAIPPGSFKYAVVNNTDQAMAATGNTLRRNPHQLQTV
jgi:hypothetical protein